MPTLTVLGCPPPGCWGGSYCVPSLEAMAKEQQDRQTLLGTSSATGGQFPKFTETLCKKAYLLCLPQR